jgi:hypothetical protein
MNTALNCAFIFRSPEFGIKMCQVRAVLAKIDEVGSKMAPATFTAVCRINRLPKE